MTIGHIETSFLHMTWTGISFYFSRLSSCVSKVHFFRKERRNSLDFKTNFQMLYAKLQMPDLLFCQHPMKVIHILEKHRLEASVLDNS